MSTKLEKKILSRWSGLKDKADAILAARQTSLILESSDNTAGLSRLGGLPIVGPGFDWPKLHDTNLSFIAQLDLPSLSAFNTDLPDKGSLLFFYDADQESWGFDPKHKNGFAVIYFEELPEIEITDFPEDLPDHGKFRSKTVGGRLADSYPPDQSEAMEALGLTSKEADRLADLFYKHLPLEDTSHKALGFPDQIQGDMQRECQLASNGVDCGGPAGYKSQRAKELEPGVGDWRLLLQIDSDDDCGMMWGDVGRIYFWIRQQDLANRAFENCWCILQCT